MAKTLVMGLGNPILGDDGVGWKVAMEVKQQLPISQDVVVDCLSLGGLSLMEHLIGYDRAILVDAFALDDPIGSILILKLQDLPHYSAFRTVTRHDIPLQNAIELGRAMGAKLPKDINVVGIATKHVHHFSKKLSMPVAKAVTQAAHIVLDLLDEKIQPGNF